MALQAPLHDAASPTPCLRCHPRLYPARSGRSLRSPSSRALGVAWCLHFGLAGIDAVTMDLKAGV
eukprot:scaffold63505_cov28-Tisochrysis_lutea.AAC.3